jgi:uncharacterized protein GlcG (DUF336 family)
MKKLLGCAAAAGLFVLSGIALAQPPGGGRPPPPPPSLMTYDMALEAIDAAEAHAREQGWGVTILVTDQNGNAVMMRRLDNASPRTFDIAQMKAVTVVTSGMTSAEYGMKVQAGEIEQAEGTVTFGGGVPVYVDGVLVGAVTASGVQPGQDEEVSVAGAEAIGSISAD